jgi:hypothetical protein
MKRAYDALDLKVAGMMDCMAQNEGAIVKGIVKSGLVIASLCLRPRSTRSWSSTLSPLYVHRRGRRP